jgi:hypothetical protein
MCYSFIYFTVADSTVAYNYSQHAIITPKYGLLTLNYIKTVWRI